MSYIAYNMMIVSKYEVWRRIVSVAEKVLIEAQERGLPIILYIHKDKVYDFLKFTPEQFFELNDSNWRGTPPELFYNIPARFGEQLENPKVAKLEDFGIVGGG